MHNAFFFSLPMLITGYTVFILAESDMVFVVSNLVGVQELFGYDEMERHRYFERTLKTRDVS